MRIAYVCQPADEQAAPSVARAAEALRALGAWVERVSCEDPAPARSALRAGVTRLREQVELVRSGPLHYLEAARRAWRSAATPAAGACLLVRAGALAVAARRRGLDVLHARGEGAARLAALAAFLSRLPYSLEDAEGVAAELLAGARLVVAPDAAARARLMARVGPLHWPRLHVVHPAARPAPAAGEGDGTRLYFQGPLDGPAGVPLLLEAVEALTPELPEVHLTVVGDGPLRAWLAGEVERRGLRDRVALVSASTAQADALLARADVVLVPSLDERPAGVLTQALAAGVPVVASRTGSAAELIEDGREGLLVAPGDAAALAGKAAALLRDPALRRRLGGAGRARASREADPRREAGWFLELQRRAVVGARAGVRPAPGEDLPGEVTPSRRYCLITPCRDEASFGRRTLESVTRQTLTPALWVIVDDGSTDATPALLAEYAARFPWIRVVRRDDRGGRSVGPGVIEAFYAGYATIDPREFDYVCKLDLDLDLPLRYFETLIERMELDPRLGTCSGKPYYPGPNNLAKDFTGELISEGCGDETSIGAAKLYRTACFLETGGFIRQVMWDGIDCHRCRLLGWRACSWDDPELRFVHLRPMGSSQKGLLTGRARHGYGQWFMGTAPIYMAASALYRLTRPPRVTGGAAMAWGYLRAWWRQEPRYEDLEFRRFLREFQVQGLLRGKRWVTALLDERQRAVWLARQPRAVPRAEVAADPPLPVAGGAAS